jgi:SPP1 gp7 family putative phage head morphogenesis protein
LTQTRARDLVVARVEAEYLKELIRLESRSQRLIEAWIDANSKEALAQDAGEAELLRRLRGLFSDPRRLRAFFGRTVSLINADVVESFASIVPTAPRSALVSPVSLEGFAETNARLIKSVPNIAIDRLSDIIRNGAGRGEGALQRAIQQAFSVSKSRASFWARDQTLKLHGQITKERHLKAGISTYYWTDSGDERTREIHSELGERSDGGEVFAYKDPPVISEDGRRGNPGDDFNCRCTPYPNLPT